MPVHLMQSAKKRKERDKIVVHLKALTRSYERTPERFPFVITWVGRRRELSSKSSAAEKVSVLDTDISPPRTYYSTKPLRITALKQFLRVFLDIYSFFKEECIYALVAFVFASMALC